jgi:hypothetical protein
MKYPSLSSTCTILLGVAIAIGSSASLVIDVTSTLNPVAIILDIIFMFVSYMTVWNGISSYVIDKITRKKMEEEWEYKVQPLITLISDTTGRLDKISEDILQTNLKLDSTLSYVIKSQNNMEVSKVMIYPGASFMLVVKVLSMIVITTSALVYTAQYPLGIIHYFILGLYLAWWALFTSEYKLYNNSTAWVWAVLPTVIIPTLGMLLDTLIGLNTMMAVLFAGLFIYSYSYYRWSCYITTGYKLIDLTPIKFMLTEKLKRKEMLK